MSISTDFSNHVLGFMDDIAAIRDSSSSEIAGKTVDHKGHITDKSRLGKMFSGVGQFLSRKSSSEVKFELVNKVLTQHLKDENLSPELKKVYGIFQSFCHERLQAAKEDRDFSHESVNALCYSLQLGVETVVKEDLLKEASGSLLKDVSRMSFPIDRERISEIKGQVEGIRHQLDSDKSIPREEHGYRIRMGVRANIQETLQKVEINIQSLELADLQNDLDRLDSLEACHALREKLASVAPENDVLMEELNQVEQLYTHMARTEEDFQAAFNPLEQGIVGATSINDINVQLRRMESVGNEMIASPDKTEIPPDRVEARMDEIKALGLEKLTEIQDKKISDLELRLQTVPRDNQRALGDLRSAIGRAKTSVSKYDLGAEINRSMLSRLDDLERSVETIKAEEKILRLESKLEKLSSLNGAREALDFASHLPQSDRVVRVIDKTNRWVDQEVTKMIARSDGSPVEKLIDMNKLEAQLERVTEHVNAGTAESITDRVHVAKQRAVKDILDQGKLVEVPVYSKEPKDVKELETWIESVSNKFDELVKIERVCTQQGVEVPADLLIKKDRLKASLKLLEADRDIREMEMRIARGELDKLSMKWISKKMRYLEQVLRRDRDDLQDGVSSVSYLGKGLLRGGNPVDNLHARASKASEDLKKVGQENPDLTSFVMFFSIMASLFNRKEA